METWSPPEDIGQDVGSVLLIEPDPVMARAMESELLRGGFRVHVVHSHLGALGMMEDLTEPHILLVPTDATDIDGFDFIHLVRHRNRLLNHNLRIIMVGSGESFSSYSRHEEGIDDFLLRPYFPGELVWRVRKAWDILENRRHTASLSHFDASTGILTAIGLKRVLLAELNKSSRKQDCFSLAMIMFHRLEEVQLNYGLMMAEWMERDLSETIRLSLRSYDRLGKITIGGYCLLAPEIDQGHLRRLLDRLGRKVMEWNDTVAKNSLLRIPLEAKVRTLTIRPLFEPEHLPKAVTLLWDWVQRRDDHVDIAQAECLELYLTPQIVSQQRIPETTPDGIRPGLTTA